MENPFKFFKRNPKKEPEIPRLSGGMSKTWESLNASTGREEDIRGALIEFDPAEIKEAFPSEDLQSMFDKVWASTSPALECVNQKRLIALEISKKQLLDKEVLGRGTTVYIGAGTDIEYPILVGARDITLVDYGFENLKGYIEAVKEKIKNSLGDREVRVEGNVISFDLDIGGGQKERVMIRLEIKQIAGGPFPLEKEAYVPGNNTAMLMSYASGGAIDRDMQLVDNVMPGGYILTESTLREDEELREHGFERTALEAEKIKDIKLLTKNK